MGCAPNEYKSKNMKEKTKTRNIREKYNRTRKTLRFCKFLKTSQNNDLIPKKFIICDKFFFFFLCFQRSFPSPQRIPCHSKKRTESINPAHYFTNTHFYAFTSLQNATYRNSPHTLLYTSNSYPPHPPKQSLLLWTSDHSSQMKLVHQKKQKTNPQIFHPCLPKGA